MLVWLLVDSPPWLATGLILALTADTIRRLVRLIMAE